jgi:hypothetical protein
LDFLGEIEVKEIKMRSKQPARVPGALRQPRLSSFHRRVNGVFEVCAS